MHINIIIIELLLPKDRNQLLYSKILEYRNVPFLYAHTIKHTI